MGRLDRVSIAKVGKRYGTERALASVSLELTGGSMCALLGHNGAGKTTLLGIVSSLVRPDGGEVTYHSGDAKLKGEAVRREIGLLAHASLCYAELSAVENLEFVAGLYGITTKTDEPGLPRRGSSAEGQSGVIDEPGLPRRGSSAEGQSGVIDAVLDQVGLDKRARDRAARTYSRGMLQRLALARALLTKPSLLLLDEPFTGLDRDGALALGEQLGALKQDGTIVVVVTHDLEAIAGRTDHVAILRRGKLVCEERNPTAYTYEQLKDLYHRNAA